MNQRTSPTLDGFRSRHCEAFASFSPTIAHHFYAAVESLGERLDVRIEGLERLPKGRALIVANHAFGYDVVLPLAAIARRLDRRVFVLGEHAWWKVPYLRRFVTSIGVVDGTRANVDRLLAADELVLVLPGGLRESVKPRELRYRLLWGHRYGFVRAAIRNRAPLVPLAGVGADDLFDFVGNPFRRGARWLGHPEFPVPLPARLLPIPHFARFSYAFGEPIVPPSSSEVAADPTLVRRLRREVEGALHELIENELAKRVGMDPRLPEAPAGS